MHHRYALMHCSLRSLLLVWNLIAIKISNSERSEHWCEFTSTNSPVSIQSHCAQVMTSSNQIQNLIPQELNSQSMILKRKPMTDQKLLDADLHLRISKTLEQSLTEVADSYNLKKATLGRMIIQRHLNDYRKNRLFAWVRNRLWLCKYPVTWNQQKLFSSLRNSLQRLNDCWLEKSRFRLPWQKRQNNIKEINRHADHHSEHSSQSVASEWPVAPKDYVLQAVLCF